MEACKQASQESARIADKKGFQGFACLDGLELGKADLGGRTMATSDRGRYATAGYRILHIVPSLDGGGAEPVALLVAQHQSRFFAVHLAHWLGERPVGHEAWPEESPKVVRLERNRRGLLGAIQLVLAIRRHIRSNAITHVVSHLFYTNICVGLALVLLLERPRYLLVEHGFPVQRPKLVRILTNFIYRHFPPVACSSELADYWARRLQLPGIEAIPNPIVLPTARRHLRTAVPHDRFIAIGRLDVIKNYEFLVRAWAHVPPEAQLAIYGSGDEQYRRMLSSLIEELGLETRVGLMGSLPREQLLGKLTESTALLMASHREGEPTVVLEAAALGVPVIARDTPGLGSCVLKVGGCVVPAESSPQEFARVIASTHLVNSIDPEVWLPLHSPSSAAHRYCSNLGISHE